VSCPLHEGKFDLGSGDPVQMPTTGGLDPDGVYHPVWTPAGSTVKDDVPGRKATARRYTRVRRLHYYPVRIVDGSIQLAVPAADGVSVTLDQAPPAFFSDPERATA
jgi:nitrite reductase/ring-hydroxylating ferredoxin subunit